MLHSKAFAEDCLRHRKMALWSEGFPFELVWQSINRESLTYTCSESSKMNFQKTGLAWDNLDDPDYAFIECSRCRKQTQVPWTTRRRNGLAHDRFQHLCHYCKFSLCTDNILVQKLRRDLYSLLEENIPLPGTYFSPEVNNDSFTPNIVTNELFGQSLRTFLLEETRPSNLFPRMDDIIASSAKAIGDKNVPMLHDVFRHYQYVDNSSCNLHAAVMRVLESASTMQNLGFSQTDTRLPVNQAQYVSFLRRCSKESRDRITHDMADPIILVWSTHQLAARSYCEFTRKVCDGMLFDWQPVHHPATCNLCHTLQPPSFIRQFLRGITSWEEWKVFLSSHPFA